MTTTSIPLNSMDAEAYYNRGNRHVEAGNYEQAIADFTEAIRLEPEEPDIFLPGAAAFTVAWGIRSRRWPITMKPSG